MPTGYTADVADGKVKDLPTFVLTCARAFGALITMRDSSPDAPIPDEFKPSDYHTNALATATTRLEQVRTMTPAQVAEEAGKARGEWMSSRQAARRKNQDTADNYRDMLAKVKAWKPPTADHQGLRDFMEQQLNESLAFDCREIEWEIGWETPQEWHLRQIESAARDVAYHTKEQAEEEKRARERTEWVRALRRSLAT